MKFITFKNTMKNLLLLFLPALLISINFSLYWLFSSWTFFNIDLFVIYTLFLSILIFYTFLYKKLNLKRSIYSFIAFLFNILILLLYLRGFYYISVGLPDPIYLPDLSIYSQYRYLIFFTLSVLGFIVYAISLKYSKILHVFSKVSYPYLKEEIRYILYYWHDSFMGNLCCYVYRRLKESTRFTYLFFSLHFIIFYLLRIITLVLFINLVFFSGDLRSLLYLIPLSFLSWILSFIDYYFKNFREGTSNFIAEILDVTYVKHITDEEKKQHYILIQSLDHLQFKMLPAAFEEGFTENDLEFLKSKWYGIVCNDRKFTIYSQYTAWMSYILFFAYTCCWFYITAYFFSPLFNETYFSMFFRRSIFNKPQIPLRSPRDVRHVKEGAPMNEVKIHSKGAVSPGHPVIGEIVDNAKFRVDGALTHGKGTAEHPSIPLSPSGIPPDYKPVYFVPTVPFSIDDHKVHLPIQGSEIFCNKPEHKSKMDTALKDYAKKQEKPDE